MNDEIEVRQVDAARRDVGGDADARASVAQRLQRLVRSFWVNSPDSATTEKPRSDSVACRCRTALRVLQNTSAPGDSKKRSTLTTACSTSAAAIRMARYSISA